MADGFGFRLDDQMTPLAVDQTQQGDAAEAVTAAIAAGTGAGAPETWWGELLEFATPLLACVCFAVVCASFAPDGWSLMMAGVRT